MHTPPRILVVDDQPQNVELLQDRLEGEGYEILTATAGEAALDIVTTEPPDLILLDIIMPGMDGLEVCRRLKANVSLPFIPVIIITAKSEAPDIVTGFEAGADEYLTKPLDQAALMARVKSMLRLKSFHDTAWNQATQFEAQAAALERWNEMLEGQMQEQMTDLERMGRLKRFLPPSLAERVVSVDDAAPIRLQRQEVTVLCCTLHGFAPFVDMIEPEVVVAVLSAYHRSLGPLMTEFDGTLERWAGDQLWVVFHAALASADPVLRAVGLATAMRPSLKQLCDPWRARGYSLEVGLGIAHGEATLGLMDLDGQWDYVVLGSVRHLASRLSEAAQGGQIFVSPPVWEAVAKRVHANCAGALALEGHPDPIPFFEVSGVKARD